MFGGDEAVLRNTEFIADDVNTGRRTVRLTSLGATFKVTAIHESEQRNEEYARRFFNLTRLPAVHWGNKTRDAVRLKTLTRQDQNNEDESIKRMHLHVLPLVVSSRTLLSFTRLKFIVPSSILLFLTTIE